MALSDSDAPYQYVTARFEAGMLSPVLAAVSAALEEEASATDGPLLGAWMGAGGVGWADDQVVLLVRPTGSAGGGDLARGEVGPH